MAGPARGHSRRATAFRAVLPCLALIAFEATPALAQTVTPDLFSSTRSSQIITPDSPLRRTGITTVDKTGNDANDARLRERDTDTPAPSRIGQIPSYGLPAASGAADIGYDSLNRTRKKPKYYPGQVKPKPPAGPGSPPPPIATNTPLRLSIPPSESANKAPIPPAMAGTVAGQPPRKRLKIDDDPFGPVGDYAGGFLIKSALELSGGYDTNPGRTAIPKGSPFYVIAPEFLAVSDWERHALVADLRGSFTGYGNTFPPPSDGTVSSAPTNVDRPDFTGHVDGRLDVTHDTRLLAEVRLRVATDNPGSPNVQAGLAKFPIYTTLGGTFGFDQNFNRLQVSGGATVRSHRLSMVETHRRHLDQQRRPQLHPIWRRRPRQLRSDAGRKTVRGRRSRQPRARRAARPQRLCPRFHRRLRQGRLLLRVQPHPVRRNLDRLCRARLCRRPAGAAAGPVW